MSVTACAQIVEKGDPDRFLAVMAAPVAVRAKLWPIYAYNVEVARAPWVTQEPGIAEIRVQWWRDAVEEIGAVGAVRRHEVVEPLADVVREAGLDVAGLDGIAAARRWDIYTESFEDRDAFRGYLEGTSGALLEVACGVVGEVHPAARAVGYAQGVANWLMAVPGLEARGRRPLVDGTHAGLVDLAGAALEGLRAARAVDFGAAVPVVRAAWRAEAVLQQVLRDPGAVAEGRLGGSEFQRRAGLAWRVFSGRW